jgi:hypothetical protein
MQRLSLRRDGVAEPLELGGRGRRVSLGIGAAGEVVAAEVLEWATATTALLFPWRRLICSYWARR